MSGRSTRAPAKRNVLVYDSDDSEDVAVKPSRTRVSRTTKKSPKYQDSDDYTDADSHIDIITSDDDYSEDSDDVSTKGKRGAPKKASATTKKATTTAKSTKSTSKTTASTKKAKGSSTDDKNDEYIDPSMLPLLDAVAPTFDPKVIEEMSRPRHPNPPPPDIIRILITTDNHLGFAEDNPIRGEDSFRTFEECLRVGKDNHCDMYLFGGDLFHENKPSRNTLLRTTQLLKHYCTGTKQPDIQIISDESQHFSDGSSNFNPPVKYDENNQPIASNRESTPMNISIPAFTIHGNHDDPTGHPPISALDILHEAKLLNYFGKHRDLDRLVINPLVIQKGMTFLSLYGVGNLRDERMAAIFRQRDINFNQFIPSQYIQHNLQKIQLYNEYVNKTNDYVTKCRELLEQQGGLDSQHTSTQWGEQPIKKASTSASTSSKLNKTTKKGKGKDDEDVMDPLVPRPYNPTQIDILNIFGPEPLINHNYQSFDARGLSPEELDDNVCHVPIIHQNRCRSCLSNQKKTKDGKRKTMLDDFTENPHGMNSINPCLFPIFSDIIIWGHEHCCQPNVLRIDPTQTNKKLREEYIRFKAMEKQLRLKLKSKARSQAIPVGSDDEEDDEDDKRRGRNTKGNTTKKDAKKDKKNDKTNDPVVESDSDDDDELDEDEIALFQHDRDISVLQPGSTVITSLCDGESWAKHCFIMEVRASNYRVNAIKLQSARQFVIQTLILTNEEKNQLEQDTKNQALLPVQQTNRTIAAAQRKEDMRKRGTAHAVNNTGTVSWQVDPFTKILINKTCQMLKSLPARTPRYLLPPLAISDRVILENPELEIDKVLDLPLIRIRITKKDFKDKFSLSSLFLGRVANPDDITLIVAEKLSKAQRMLLQRQTIKSTSTSARINNLVANVTAGMQNQRDKNNPLESLSNAPNTLVDLAHSMLEISDLLLLNLINDGNLSFIHHSVVLDSLSSYVNNRDNNIGSKSSGLDNPWVNSVLEYTDSIREQVELSIDKKSVKDIFNAAYKNGTINEVQRDMNIEDYLAEVDEIAECEDDRQRKARFQQLHERVNRMRASNHLYPIISTEEENSTKIIDLIVKGTQKHNDKYNSRTLNQKMALLENDTDDDEDDEDEEDEEQNHPRQQQQQQQQQPQQPTRLPNDKGSSNQIKMEQENLRNKHSNSTAMCDESDENQDEKLSQQRQRQQESPPPPPAGGGSLRAKKAQPISSNSVNKTAITKEEQHDERKNQMDDRSDDDDDQTRAINQADQNNNHRQQNGNGDEFDDDFDDDDDNGFLDNVPVVTKAMTKAQREADELARLNLQIEREKQYAIEQNELLLHAAGGHDDDEKDDDSDDESSIWDFTIKRENNSSSKSNNNKSNSKIDDIDEGVSKNKINYNTNIGDRVPRQAPQSRIPGTSHYQQPLQQRVAVAPSRPVYAQQEQQQQQQNQQQQSQTHRQPAQQEQPQQQQQPPAPPQQQRQRQQPKPPANLQPSTKISNKINQNTNMYDLEGCGDDPTIEQGNYTDQEKKDMLKEVQKIQPTDPVASPKTSWLKNAGIDNNNNNTNNKITTNNNYPKGGSLFARVHNNNNNNNNNINARNRSNNTNIYTTNNSRNGTNGNQSQPIGLDDTDDSDILDF